jgi:RND family efflux transporter MFP subunit
MNDSSALLNQLRIDRSSTPQNSGGNHRGWIIAAVVVLIIVAAVATAFLMMPSGVPVKVVQARAIPTVGPAVGASMLDASGYVVARRTATVSAKITDKVTEVLIEEGQHVKTGEVVARLDETNIRAGFEQAQAQLAAAKASLSQVQVNLVNAERDYARKKDLFAQHFVSQSDLDDSQTALDGLRAQLQTAQRNVDVAGRGVDVAQTNLNDTIIRAPFDGVITDKAAQPGEIVSPISAGSGFTRTGIGTIVDMDSLEVEVDVNENFINRVTPGQRVSAKLNAYPDWQIPAHVIAVIPTADRSKATVKVRVAFEQKDPRILPEMGIRVAFLSDAPSSGGTAQAGFIVPVEAVQIDGGNGIVYLIHDGTAERRAIKLGARNGDEQTVLSGLTGNDQLAIGDFSKLGDGVKVRIQK